MLDRIAEERVPLIITQNGEAKAVLQDVGQQVIIYVVADGRRDMQSVLARRLLGA